MHNAVQQDFVFKKIGQVAGWKMVSAGLPGDAGVRSLAIDSHTSNIMRAETFAYGVFKSLVAGLSWNPAKGYPVDGLSLALFHFPAIFDVTLTFALVVTLGIGDLYFFKVK